MKYSLEIEIEKPLEEVSALFWDPDNLPKWQDGFISAERLDGVPGEEGSQTTLKYKMGGRELEMIETIHKSNPPYEFHASFNTKGVSNIQENYFESVDGSKTKWLSVSEFKFGGLGMKLMGALMPGAFKKQSYKYMRDFKAFAEKGIEVGKS